MTKEELEKEAGDYADKHAFRVPYDGSNKFYDDVDFKASKEGYLAGAKPREKRIAELEKENREQKKQIEWLDMAINSDIPIADKLAELEKVCNKNMELADEIDKLENENKLLGECCNQLLADKGKLTDENAELKKELDEIDKAGEHVRQQINDAFRNKKPYWELERENLELKSKIGLSIDCEKAHKNGELCLGYGGDEDEPCERCKNCIKCESGYYQLGETEKDEQLNKAKDLIEDMYDKIPASHSDYYKDVMERARQFLQETKNDRRRTCRDICRRTQRS